MAKIRVRCFFALVDKMEQPEMELEIQDASLRSVLDKLPRLEPPLIDPETEEVNPYYTVLVNGHNSRNLPGGLNVILKEEDVVQIFPPVGGG